MRTIRVLALTIAGHVALTAATSGVLFATHPATPTVPATGTLDAGGPTSGSFEVASRVWGVYPTDVHVGSRAASARAIAEVEPGQRPTAGPAPVSPNTKHQALEAYGRLPLAFVPNAGQANADIRLFAQGPGFRLAFLRGEAHFAFTQTAQGKTRGAAVALRFLGARPGAEPEGGRPGTGRVNYLLGNDPTQWRTGLPTYGDVVYRNLWPGIDLAFRGQDGQLKYELEVEPGARPADIGFTYAGAEGLRLGSDGSLVIDTALGPLTDTAPVSYQEIDGRRVSVESRFVLDPAQPGAFRIEVGAYDPAERLFIDPGLVYSTFLGGNGNERLGGTGIAIDGAGSAYVTGSAGSTDFPTTPGAFDTTFNSVDAFVTKLNPAGSSLVYSTFIGGSSDDEGYDIALDTGGNAYVTGFTASPDFPTTPGSFQDTDPDCCIFGDGFVTKLNSTGSALVYSTYLGSSSNTDDQGFGIAVDAAGSAYVAGVTNSNSFPTTPGAFDTTHNGGYDVFVTKLNPSGTAPLLYSTFLGGSLNEGGNPVKVAIDAAGSAYVTSFTGSPNFPTTPGAFDTTFNGGTFDAFVTKLNPSGTAPLLYSTFLGSSGEDLGFRIAIDAAGSAYVTGSAGSTDFPTTPGAFDTTFNGGASDAFVTKLDPSGTAALYSTFLGGSGDGAGIGIAIDGAGSAYVTGSTGSADFPTTPGAFDTTFNGGIRDAFVTKLNPSGTAPLLYSTFLGGSGNDSGRGIAIDAAGSAYVTGRTETTDFPTTPGAFDTTFNGGTFDAFVTKLELVGTPTMLVLTPVTATNPVGTNHTVTATVTDAAGQPAPGVVVRFTVTGAHMLSGSCTTGPNGECTFTYTGTQVGGDAIDAYADSDNDNVQDLDEPTGAATKVWTPPTPGCPPQGGDDDEDDDGLEDMDEDLFGTLLGNPDSDGDGDKDGNDDSDGDGEDDEDEDDDTEDECPNDSDGDGEDDEDEDDP